MFSKAPNRIRCFKEKCPGLPLPPEPVITRWGTWLVAAIYYTDNYEAIRDIIEEFNSEDAAAIDEAKSIFKKSTIKADLAKIKGNFYFLVPVIKTFQETSMELTDAGKTLKGVIEKFQKLPAEDKVLKTVKEKWDKVFENNTGLRKLLELDRGN